MLGLNANQSCLVLKWDENCFGERKEGIYPNPGDVDLYVAHLHHVHSGCVYGKLSSCYTVLPSSTIITSNFEDHRVVRSSYLHQPQLLSHLPPSSDLLARFIARLVLVLERLQKHTGVEETICSQRVSKQNLKTPTRE